MYTKALKFNKPFNYQLFQISHLVFDSRIYNPHSNNGYSCTCICDHTKKLKSSSMVKVFTLWVLFWQTHISNGVTKHEFQGTYLANNFSYRISCLQATASIPNHRFILIIFVKLNI